MSCEHHYNRGPFQPVLHGSCASTEISQLGEKYVDKEIENAINGVKEMKTLMEKSDEDHERFLSSLEETKKQKEVSEDFQTYFPDCEDCNNLEVC